MPEIIKNEADEILDKTTSYMNSDLDEDEKITNNNLHESSLKTFLSTPRNTKKFIYSDSSKRFENKQIRNHYSNERYLYYSKMYYLLLLHISSELKMSRMNHSSILSMVSSR